MSSTQGGGQPEPVGGWDIPNWISRTLVLVPLSGAMLVFIGVAMVGLPRLYHSVIPGANGLLPAAAAELATALKEHQAVVSVAQLCVGGKDMERQSLDAEPFAAFDIQHPIIEAITLSGTPPRAGLPGYLDATLYLSQAIASARGQLAGKAVIDNLLSELFQWTIVATGLFTTILISVKAFARQDSSGYLSMAVMAIVLSSFGTAVATLNSFYTPRIEYEKTQHALASLRALHWTVAGEMLRAKAPCDDKSEWTAWRPRHVRDLSNAFTAIMTTSMRSGSSADDGPNVQGGGDKPGSDGDLKPNAPSTPGQTADNHAAPSR